jgi:hypothetical protein
MWDESYTRCGGVVSIGGNLPESIGLILPVSV